MINNSLFPSCVEGTLISSGSSCTIQCIEGYSSNITSCFAGSMSSGTCNANPCSASTVKNSSSCVEGTLISSRDEEIAITHKLIKQVKSKGGSLLSATTDKETFEYLMTLTNSKKTSAEVVVWDHLPIPSVTLKSNLQLLEILKTTMLLSRRRIWRTFDDICSE